MVFDFLVIAICHRPNLDRRRRDSPESLYAGATVDLLAPGTSRSGLELQFCENGLNVKADVATKCSVFRALQREDRLMRPAVNTEVPDMHKKLEMGQQSIVALKVLALRFSIESLEQRCRPL